MKVYAQNTLPTYSDIGLNFKFEGKSLGEIITALLPYTFAFAGFGLLIFLIIGGFKLMTSSGNPEQLARGQKTITNAVIGFVIVISAYWLTQIAETILGLSLTQ